MIVVEPQIIPRYSYIADQVREQLGLQSTSRLYDQIDNQFDQSFYDQLRRRLRYQLLDQLKGSKAWKSK